jgi:hypothetical protein
MSSYFIKGRWLGYHTTLSQDICSYHAHDLGINVTAFTRVKVLDSDAINSKTTTIELSLLGSLTESALKISA